MAKEDKEKDKKAVEAKPKPKKKLMVIGVAALMLLLGGGGGAWYFLKDKKSPEEKKVAESDSLQAIFTPLDPFTVNLQREEGDQVLQVGLSLKYYNKDLDDKIKNAMPEIRSSLLLLLSSKHASELVSVTGKKKLANEIIYSVNTILGTQRESVPKAPAPEAKEGNGQAAAAIPAAPAESQASAPASGSAAAPPAEPKAGASGPAPAAATGNALVTAVANNPVQGAPVAPVAAASAAPAAPAAPASPALPPVPDDKTAPGVVGVLFTSFIIQ